VNTVVIQDYVNSARRATGSDAFEKLDELNRTLSIEYLVDKASTADIQGAEDAFLLVSARRRNPGSFAAWHPYSPYDRQKVKVAFVLKKYVIPGYRRTKDLCDSVHLGLRLRIISPLRCMPRAIVPKPKRFQQVIHCSRTNLNAIFCFDMGT